MNIYTYAIRLATVIGPGSTRLAVEETEQRQPHFEGCLDSWQCRIGSNGFKTRVGSGGSVNLR